MVLVFCFQHAETFGQRWVSSERIGDTKQENILDLEIYDNTTFLLGTFKEDLDLGTGYQLDPIGLGKASFFVAKMDLDGNVLDVQSANPIGTNGQLNLPGHASANQILFFENGSLLIHGSYNSSTLSVGAHSIQKYSNVDDREEAFLLKLDQNLEVIWLKGIGSSGAIEGGETRTYFSKGIVDADDRIHLAFHSNAAEVYFPGNVTLDRDFVDRSYVVSLDQDGNFLDTVRVDRGMVTAMAVTGDNQLIIGGDYFDEMRFMDEALQTNLLADMFLVKYDPDNRTVGFARSFGGEMQDDNMDDLRGICLDAQDNIYLSGYCTDVAQFGYLLLGKASKSYQGFVVKLDADGEGIWGRTLSTSGFSGSAWVHSIGLQGGKLIGSLSLQRTPGETQYDFNDKPKDLAEEYNQLIFAINTTDGGLLWSYPQHAARSTLVAYAENGKDIVCGGWLTTHYQNNDTLINGIDPTSGLNLDIYISRFTDMDKIQISSVAELSNDQAVNLYPNPAHESFWIESDVSISRAQILSIDGRMILELNPAQQVQSLLFSDLVKLSPGSYLVRVDSENETTVKKVIIY